MPLSLRLFHHAQQLDFSTLRFNQEALPHAFYRQHPYFASPALVICIVHQFGLASQLLATLFALLFTERDLQVSLHTRL